MTKLTLNATTMNTQDVQANRLRLGDVLVLDRLPELGGGWELMVVNKLARLNEDVEVNDNLLTSGNNKLTVVR